MVTRRLLQIEFLAFYVAVPLAMAVLMPPRLLFPALAGFTLLGALLLHLTPGFRWRDLARGLGRIDWRFVAGFSLATLGVAVAVALWLAPGAFLALPRQSPALWLAVLALYPVLSALPQELIFRPLFFRRYGGLLPGRRAAIAVNAAVFSLAHLMYWNWPALAMSFAGGLAFAHAYEHQKNFPAAVVLHAIAGGIVFTAGLGVFFYTGFVRRPF